MKNSGWVLFFITWWGVGCSPSRVILNRVNTRFPENPGTAQKVVKGVYWYKWLGKDTILNRNESINALVIDLDKAPVTYDFAWFNDRRNTVSYVADTALAIAAVNSGYFEYLTDGGYVAFHKSHSKIDQEVGIPPSHIRYWKHQAAFIQTSNNDFAFITGDQNTYRQLPFPNIISSAPLLISNGIPVGKFFVKQKTGDKSHLDGEHPDRHQGGLGPRIAFATTQDRKLILLAVDGRSPLAQGVNAEELTDLLYDYFNAYQAVNMDGGGSMTMFLRGATPTGVVNYPSDQRKTDPNSFEHHGQRKVGMAFLILPKTDRLRKKMQRIPVAIDPYAKDYLDNPIK